MSYRRDAKQASQCWQVDRSAVVILGSRLLAKPPILAVILSEAD
jgi:hypothetical protein